MFRDVISLSISTHCEPRHPKGSSGGQFVSASRAVQASEARLLVDHMQTLVDQLQTLVDQMSIHFLLLINCKLSNSINCNALDFDYKNWVYEENF